MTTPKQRDANRRNATKSTGPRTTAGKAAAARNARRHGLYTAPGAKDVAAMCGAIQGVSPAPSGPWEMEPMAVAVQALAEAEVQLARIKTAEKSRMTELADEIAASSGLDRRRAQDALCELVWHDPQLAAKLFPETFGSSLSVRGMRLQRELRSLGRLRRRTASRRRRAFWCWYKLEAKRLSLHEPN